MDFIRPKEGFEYDFRGIKVNSVPNAIPPNKFPYAQNIRSIGGGSIKSRPGQTLKFTIGNPTRTFTDMRAYSTLGTDNLPRILVRDNTDVIYLDNGVSVGSLVAGGLGATFIPFRPGRSPQSWLYVANGADYQKFSSPVANSVTQRKVGIAEPQSSPEACPDQYSVNSSGLPTNAAAWAAAGTAGVLSDVTRVTDTVVALFADPASVAPSITTRYSMQVGTAVQYQVGEILSVNKAGGGQAAMVVQDVLPPAAANSTLTILAIQYFAGATGRCVIVPSQMPIDNSVPELEGLNPIGDSLTNQALLGGLRRGSLVSLGTGGNLETVFILNVTHGPQGLVAFECVTVNTHVATDPIQGLPAITVSFGEAPALLVGQTITSASIQSSVAVGTGSVSVTIAAANNPFAFIPSLGGSTLPSAQQDDYVHFSALFSDLTLLTSVRIMFDVGDGSFTQNFYYYDVQPSALVAAVAGTQSQLGAAQTSFQQSITRAELNADIVPTINPELARLPVESTLRDIGVNTNPSGTTALGASQFTEVMFPIVAFTRVGNDLTKSLANVNACRIQVTVTNTVTFRYGSVWVGDGMQPDVGQNGVLYLYRVRPRDSRTGAVGNPSPATRYGVSPRRQRVILPLPSAAYDPQIDTWDVFRFGGTVTSWRYVGSAPSASASFADNVFDSEARAGDPLDFDNFEPWPSVDTPQNLTATSVTGTIALVTIPSPTNALRWLPGTLVQLAGGQFFTLRLRPVNISGTTYRLEFIECASPGTNVAVSIPEPLLGVQKLPYMLGPDASGRVLATGDPLRPGTVSYCKSNNPDSAPGTYNREITPPSEPLLGGEIVDGRAFIASPERWWEMIPQQTDDPTNFYNPVPSPIPRGLAAPFGHATDGKQIFFWAKDGIWSTAHGSLTDEDLYNLFPHEGVAGQAVSYGGFTIQPPDYSRSGTFRLEHSNGFLYAPYQDSSGTYRVLVLDLHRMAWFVDAYTPAVSTFYHPEQQAGTVLTNATRYDETLMGTVDGRVGTQADLVNDLGGPISCAIAAFEFDGGDVRAPLQWGDFFVDLIPAAFNGVTFTPMSSSAAAAAGQVVAQGAARLRSPVTVGGLLVSDFMGLLATWSDDYSHQAIATQLNLWQPSYDIQPAYAISWQTFGSGFNVGGFLHIPYLEIAWVSTQPITLTITATDGTSPIPLVIPSSGGVYQRAFFRLTFNKGRIYAFKALSSARFQFFMDDWVIPIGPWGRSDAYTIHRELGVPNVAQSQV